MTRSRHGCVHVYTGNGKGKTTAAAGLALRALGAGLRVYFAQWMKARPSAELDMLQKAGGDRFTLERFGTGNWVRNAPAPEEIAAAAAGFSAAETAVASGHYDVVILDEINVAASLKMIPEEKLLALIRARPHAVELVLTGRNAPAAVMDAADLVTEMREVRHYFHRGVAARPGIEY